MRTGDENSEASYQSIRGEPTASIDNFLRWERIKLREASQEAIRLLEGVAQPTREYLDYMFTTDVALNDVRQRIAKHRERIVEMEAMRDAASSRV